MRIKALLIAGAFVPLAFGSAPEPASAQALFSPCVTIIQTVNGIPQTSCQAVTATNPLPVTGGGGGGGGAVTLGAGSVASGAYLSGAFAPGAFSVGSGSDGWDVAQGATANTACGTDAGTGCTMLQRLARIATNLTTLNTTASSPANIAAAATGGCTGSVILSAASNNSTSIKGTPGTLCELTWLQTTTTPMDIRLYDSAGAPTCSSATGIVANYYVASSATSPGAAINLGPFGKAFVNGIGICITLNNTNTDNTNAVTGLNVNYSFK